MRIIGRAEPQTEQDHLEANIAKLARDSFPLAYNRATPLPPVVESPMVTAEDLGKITAEAMGTSYKAVEEKIQILKTAVSKRIEEIEQLKADEKRLVESLEKLAEECRVEGERHSQQIIDTVGLLSACTEWISEMRKKLKGE